MRRRRQKVLCAGRRVKIQLKEWEAANIMIVRVFYGL